jgi:tripartite-type tricarboxylate transporter receptor subunit TctC
VRSGGLGASVSEQAPADGYTTIMASPVELSLAPLGMAAVKHKPEDLRLAAVLVNTTMSMLDRQDLPANTVDELKVAKNTPEPVIEHINKAIGQALQNPEIRKAYESTVNQVGKPMSPAELNKLHTAEIARYQGIAKSLNLQPQ